MAFPIQDVLVGLVHRRRREPRSAEDRSVAKRPRNRSASTMVRRRHRLQNAVGVADALSTTTHAPVQCAGSTTATVSDDRRTARRRHRIRSARAHAPTPTHVRASMHVYHGRRSHLNGDGVLLSTAAAMIGPSGFSCAWPFNDARTTVEETLDEGSPSTTCEPRSKVRSGSASSFQR